MLSTTHIVVRQHAMERWRERIDPAGTASAIIAAARRGVSGKKSMTRSLRNRHGKDMADRIYRRVARKDWKPGVPTYIYDWATDAILFLKPDTRIVGVLSIVTVMKAKDMKERLRAELRAARAAAVVLEERTPGKR